MNYSINQTSEIKNFNLKKILDFEIRGFDFHSLNYALDFQLGAALNDVQTLKLSARTYVVIFDLNYYNVIF